MRNLPVLALLAACLALVGCNTTAPSEDLIYQPPTGTAIARLKGSSLQDPGLFGSRHIAYVLMVNGKFVRDAEENWERPIALASGPQDLAVEYQSSVFRSRAVFTLEAKAGVTYVLKMTPGVDPKDDRRFCEFVIVEEATGQPVTPVKHTYATSVSSGSRSNFRPLD